jgi:hypothetical protein
MKRLVPLLAVAGLLAACGGGTKSQPAGSTISSGPDVRAAMSALIKAQPALAGKIRTVYQGTAWSVVQTSAGSKAHAVAFDLVGGKWQADQTARVKIAVLGPQPGAHAAPTPQVAIEITAPAAFVESGLWVDGTELLEKGGGSPTKGTIYGAPAKPLKAGVHVAVGYARTAKTGTAVAWVFRVG